MKQIKFEHVSKALEETVECAFTPDLLGPMDLVFSRKGGETKSLVKEKVAKEEKPALTLESFPAKEQEWILAQSLALNEQWSADQGMTPEPSVETPLSKADTLLTESLVLIKYVRQGNENLALLAERIREYLGSKK